MKADSELIRWLLEDSGISKYSISKATGVHQTTLANIQEGASLIENLSFKNASLLTEFGDEQLSRDTRMYIRILETGEYRPLEMVNRDGIDWTSELLGNADELNYNEETEEYEFKTAEEYIWWKQYIENWMSDDEEVVALARDLEINISEIDAKIGDELALTSDYNDHHDIIQRILEEIREEPVYAIENEDTEKAARGDFAITTHSRTLSLEQAERWYNGYFDDGDTVIMSKYQNGECEFIKERVEKRD